MAQSCGHDLPEGKEGSQPERHIEVCGSKIKSSQPPHLW